MSQQTRQYRYDFRGYNLIPVAADNAGGPFVKADTSSAGSPTVQGIAGGGVRLLLDDTSEVQNLCLYMNDILAFDIDEIIRMWAIVKTVASLDSASQLAFGLASERNDAIDSIAEAALFRCIGNNNVVVESDDGMNNNDDVSTGLTLGTTWKRFEINFKERTKTVSPPATPNKKSDISFYGANDYGSLRRVASGTNFDMSNYSGGLQLFAQLQKTADTNTDNLDILEMGVEVQLPDYA